MKKALPCFLYESHNTKWHYRVPSLLSIRWSEKKRDPRNEVRNGAGIGASHRTIYRLDCQLHPQGTKPDASSEQLRLRNERATKLQLLSRQNLFQFLYRIHGQGTSKVFAHVRCGFALLPYQRLESR